MLDLVLVIASTSDYSTRRSGNRQYRCMIPIPRTQMTPVLIGKGLVLGGLTFKNRDHLGSRYIINYTGPQEVGESPENPNNFLAPKSVVSLCISDPRWRSRTCSHVTADLLFLCLKKRMSRFCCTRCMEKNLRKSNKKNLGPSCLSIKTMLMAFSMFSMSWQNSGAFRINLRFKKGK